MVSDKSEEPSSAPASDSAPVTADQPDLVEGKTSDSSKELSGVSVHQLATKPAVPSALIKTGASKEELQKREVERVEALREAIDTYYNEIPSRLRDHPDMQSKCLELLATAEEALTPPVGRNELIRSRLNLTRLEIEMFRAAGSKISFLIVVAIVYLFAIVTSLAIVTDLIDFSSEAKVLNTKLLMGIPQPIWVWSVIGSFTSMLLRAGNFPFSNKNEAIRWLLFRPIVGVVMGVMTYLMVTAGLIVFAGSSTPQTPELLWIIAFVGSFSDTLSVNLLQRLIGRFEIEGKKDVESKQLKGN